MYFYFALLAYTISYTITNTGKWTHIRMLVSVFSKTAFEQYSILNVEKTMSSKGLHLKEILFFKVGMHILTFESSPF